jgi:hypothetical protein
MAGLELAQLERLLYLFVGVVFLILIGLMVYVFASRRRAQVTPAPLFSEEDVVLRPTHLVVGQVLTLVRDESGAPLKVEVSGTKYASLAEIHEPQVKRQIVEAAMELIQFTGVLGREAVAPAPVEKTDTWREDMREGSQTELQQVQHVSAPTEPQPKSSPPAPPEVEEQFLNLLSEMGQGSAQPERPTLVDSIQHRLVPKPVDSGRPRTLADDIEDIVQRRMQLIPALMGRELHVRPGPGASVRFVFDGKEYQEVDDIPNLTARQLIQDAIREWDETT